MAGWAEEPAALPLAPTLFFSAAFCTLCTIWPRVFMLTRDMRFAEELLSAPWWGLGLLSSISRCSRCAITVLLSSWRVDMVLGVTSPKAAMVSLALASESPRNFGGSACLLDPHPIASLQKHLPSARRAHDSHAHRPLAE
eukprot:6212517-Pleurochrysis_carterae.AAC.13